LTNDFAKGRRDGIVDDIHIIEFDLAYSNNTGFLQRSWIFFIFALRSVGLVFSEKYDLVFSTTTPLTAGIPGIFARWFCRKPFVFEVRDLWPELPREMGVVKNPVILWAMDVLEWVSYRSAYRLIGLSPGIVKGIERRGIKGQHIAMIPNGCDLNIFAGKVQAFRPEGVADSDLMAIYTGTHGIANGLDAIIDAAKELKKRKVNNIKLILVGDGKLKAGLVERVKNEKLNSVIFLDPMDKKKLSSIMAGADVGIQCLANVEAFYYGTSPNKFFDYISAGLPILNNYPGWLSDIIKEHKCGFSVLPNDAEAFCDALQHAQCNREELSLMGKAAQVLAKSNFNRADLANEFVEWLEKAVDAKT